MVAESAALLGEELEQKDKKILELTEDGIPIHKHIHVHTHTHTHIYMHMDTHTYAHSHVRTHTHTHIEMHTVHTHTHTINKSPSLPIPTTVEKLHADLNTSQLKIEKLSTQDNSKVDKYVNLKANQRV